MKTIRYILVAMLVFSMAVVLVISPLRAVSRQIITLSGCSIPDSVMMIFRNSCMGCHGEGGNSMATSIVDFSAWDTYSAKKQANKAAAILNAITKGGIPLPPASERNALPGKYPTAAQKQIICNWACSLNGK